MSQLQLFDPVISLVAENLKGREATLEESIVIDSAWSNAESSIRAMAWLSREGKTWKQLKDKDGNPYTSFEHYGKDKFGYEKAQLHNLAKAYEVQISLSTLVDKEIPETHLRPLSQIPAEDRQSIWDEAMRKAAEENKKLTAKMVQDAVDDYKRENESLSDKLNLLEVELEAYKKDEGLRLDDKLREINRKLKEEQEMANALREQRDRLNKENQDRIAVLEKALKAERDGLKSKLAEAKEEASKELKAKIDAEIKEREERLARLEAHLTDKRIELDQIEHRNSLIIDSEKTVQAINKNMMEISITLGDFMMSFDEYNGNKELPNLDAWERIFDNYQSGINVLSDLLRKFRSVSALEI